jgi:hypothetical protein
MSADLAERVTLTPEMEVAMLLSKQCVFAASLVMAFAGVSQLALAQSPTQDVVGELGNNEGYFVDGKTFKIVKGKAQGDASAQFAKLEKMGAREAGPGVTVFRYGDTLYILEGSPQPSPRR